MKLVFVGGGSFRTLPIVRGIFATPEIHADEIPDAFRHAPDCL